MSASKVTTFALILLVLAALTSAMQGPSRLQWVSCNNTSGLSCQDCNHRLICTGPLGGIVVRCLLPSRPYCVEGHCQTEPSDECREDNQTTEDY